MSEKPECFVIAPIGPDKSEIRTRSDQILKYVIRPVADECGYRAIRADEISEPGAITAQVLNRILEAPMVVADLTGSNANVFYELAVRHAIRKPYVQIIRKGESMPFDVFGIRTIELDHTDLESVALAKEEIKKQIQFTAANLIKVGSPISMAIDFASLTQSDDPLRRQLAEVLNGLSEIKTLLDTRLPALRLEPYWRSILQAGRVTGRTTATKSLWDLFNDPSHSEPTDAETRTLLRLLLEHWQANATKTALEEIHREKPTDEESK